MKFYYILANQLVSIFLSANTVTTLHFDSEISYCDRGVSQQALEIKYRRKKQSVSLVPKVEKIDSNMNCYLKDGRIFVFNLKWSKNRIHIHKNLVIKEASKVRGGVKIFENKKFILFDAGENFYLENKSNEKLTVFESQVDRFSVISKWLPLIVNDEVVKL